MSLQFDFYFDFISFYFNNVVKKGYKKRFANTMAFAGHGKIKISIWFYKKFLFPKITAYIINLTQNKKIRLSRYLLQVNTHKTFEFST